MWSIRIDNAGKTGQAFYHQYFAKNLNSTLDYFLRVKHPYTITVENKKSTNIIPTLI